MKPYKSIELPPDFLSVIGEEWAGTYTVHILSAKEYLQCAEDCINDLRSQAQAKGEVWNGQIPETDLRYRVVAKSVTYTKGKVAKSLGDLKDVPSKLYELLTSFSIPLNMLSQEEGRRLYELFR